MAELISECVCVRVKGKNGSVTEACQWVSIKITIVICNRLYYAIKIL